jgi:hypothetical protein
VTRPCALASMPRKRMGLPPRSLAADAHDCIMVRSRLWDLPNTRTWCAIFAPTPRQARLRSSCLGLLPANGATGTYDAVDPDARRALPPCSGSVKEWPRNDLRVNDPSDGHP